MRAKSENKWEEARGRGGRGEGGGNKGDSPGGAVGGLSHARTCGGCSGSPDWRKCAGGGGVPSSRSSSTSVSEQKASSFITDRHLKGRGERRVQLGQSELGEQIPAERE